MSANKRSISGKSHRKEVEVIVAGEIICTVRYNPRSEIFVRDVSRLVQALNDLAQMRGIDLPELPEIDDWDKDLTVLDSASDSLGEVADKFDTFIAAADKIIGNGVTEAIIAEDDENMTLFNKVFNPIFEEYGEARRTKIDKYRATPKAATGSPLPEVTPDPDPPKTVTDADTAALK